MRDRAKTEAQREPRFRVVLHNDPITPMEWVTWLLHEVFGFNYLHASWIMLKAHFTGQATVIVEPRAAAERHVAEAHQIARSRGWRHLTLSAEPVDGE